MSEEPRESSDLVDYGLTVHPALRWLMGLLGGGLLVAGAFAVFVTTNGPGSAAVVVAGAALVVVAVLVDRLVSIEGAGVRLQLQAHRKEQAALESEASGRAEEARRLREQAAELRGLAARTGRAYEDLRASRSSGWQRSQTIEGLLRRLARSAPDAMNPEVVREIFEEGSDGGRIVALALMADDPGVASLECIISAVSAPRSGMEQWYALRAAQRALAGGLPTAEQSLLLNAVRLALDTGDLGPDRRKLASQILEQVAP